MNQPKIFFSTNVKFLRERKKISQVELSNDLNIKRSKLNAIENAQTKSPPLEDLISFSEYFKISIDGLVKVDLSKIFELDLRQLEAGVDLYTSGNKLKVRALAITTDAQNKENTEYVPVKAKAGYRAGYSDPEFIATLPKYTIPNVPGNGTYRIFPITGDSMLPIPENSDIVARYVEDWRNIKPATACILILDGTNDFVFKLVTLQEHGNVLLESLNPNYKPYAVHVTEILEVWQFHAYQTTQFPEPPAELQSMARTINEILSDVKILKERK